MPKPIVNPPAIVKPAAELAALAAAINAAHLAGEESTRKGIGHFKVAGEALIKAKKQVGHGSWEVWCSVNLKCSKTTCERYMRVAKKWSEYSDCESMSEALGLKTDDGEEAKSVTVTDLVTGNQAENESESGQTEVDDKPRKLCRPCRTGVPNPKCKDCKKLNEAEKPEPAAATAPPAAPKPPEPPPEPEKVVDAEGEEVPPQAIPAFEMAKQITAICRQHDAMISSVEEVAKANGGRLIRFDSYKQQMKDAKGNLWANRATHVCPYCKGKDAKCKVCSGEGWVAKHIWSQAPKGEK